ncbi:MAG: YrhK family protein [Candidatus Acidifodinimicrobium sp.]
MIEMNKGHKSSRKVQRDSNVTKFYSRVSLINDLMIGLEFLLGSIQFLPGNDYSVGVYFFIVGSFQILLIPVIKLLRDMKLSVRH